MLDHVSSETSAWHGIDPVLDCVSRGTPPWHGMDTVLDHVSSGTPAWHGIDQVLDCVSSCTPAWHGMDPVMDHVSSGTPAWHGMDPAFDCVSREIFSFFTWQLPQNILSNWLYILYLSEDDAQLVSSVGFDVVSPGTLHQSILRYQIYFFRFMTRSNAFLADK